MDVFSVRLPPPELRWKPCRSRTLRAGQNCRHVRVFRGKHASTVTIGDVTRTQVVGPGGPTGVAMSPARDMGPRLAHWVLPIRGKGSSEFLSYSCVSVPIKLQSHLLDFFSYN